MKLIQITTGNYQYIKEKDGKDILLSTHILYGLGDDGEVYRYNSAKKIWYNQKDAYEDRKKENPDKEYKWDW
jgi:hypothetical protein